MVTFRDVAARRDAESARDRALAELERTLEARSRFYAGMSHELRTPINAVLGYTDLLLGGVYGELAEAQSTAVERAQGAVRHLLELVNDVLDLSKLEAGKMELELEEVSIPALVRELLVSLGPLAGQHGYELRMESDLRAATVRSDPRRMRQILLNLLSNAIKFGERKPIRIRCSAADGRGVAVEVIDGGRGIPPEQQARIFEEFVQAPGAERNATGQRGTGLGLSISARLARLLGGELEVESAPGRGSTFRLRLPAETEPPAPA